MKDENGETRRERNERFNQFSPATVVSEGGRYLWDWYFGLSRMLQRITDGVCHGIPPSEFLAWAQVENVIVLADEYAILRAMDEAFCDEMNIEFEAFRQRQAEANKPGNRKK